MKLSLRGWVIIGAVAFTAILWTAIMVIIFRQGDELSKARKTVAEQAASIVLKDATIKLQNDQIALTKRYGEDTEKLLSAIRENSRVIIQKVPTYVTKEADARAVMPLGFRSLYEASLGLPVAPLAPGQSFSTPSSVPLSATGAVIAENNAICLEAVTRYNQLNKLWDEAEALTKSKGAKP